MRATLRKGVLLGAPLLMAVTSLFHPHPPLRQPGMIAFLRPRASVWMGVHLAQLVLVLLLGIALWVLTEGLAGRAATVSRIATAAFLVFYGAFDSAVGIGAGLLARAFDADPPVDPAVAAEVMDRYWLSRFDPPIGPLIAVADLAWLVAAVAAAMAFRAHGASRSSVALLVVAGIAFAIDHPAPTGTIGMLALSAAVVLLLREGMIPSGPKLQGGLR
jgi:hypothetical protein